MAEASNRRIDSQSQSALFVKLPAEIRHQIFEFVLYVDKPEDSGVKIKKVISWEPQNSVLRLLETSRRTHREAEELFVSIQYHFPDMVANPRECFVAIRQ